MVPEMGSRLVLHKDSSNTSNRWLSFPMALLMLFPRHRPKVCLVQGASRQSGLRLLPRFRSLLSPCPVSYSAVPFWDGLTFPSQQNPFSRAAYWHGKESRKKSVSLSEELEAKRQKLCKKKNITLSKLGRISRQSLFLESVDI